MKIQLRFLFLLALTSSTATQSGGLQSTQKYYGDNPRHPIAVATCADRPVTLPSRWAKALETRVALSAFIPTNVYVFEAAELPKEH